MQGWPQTKSGRDVRLASRRGEDMTASAAPGVDVAGAMAALETARLGISELPAPHVQELYEVAKPDTNLAACAAAVRCVAAPVCAPCANAAAPTSCVLDTGVCAVQQGRVLGQRQGRDGPP